MAEEETVRRFVDEAVNAGRDEVIDELFTADMAGWVQDWFGAFRRSFPDMRMELVELVADDKTVVARFACSATHLGEWRSHAPTGRRFERVDEVFSSPSVASASLRSGASRTASTASSNSASTRTPHDS